MKIKSKISFILFVLIISIWSKSELNSCWWTPPQSYHTFKVYYNGQRDCKMLNEIRLNIRQYWYDWGSTSSFPLYLNYSLNGRSFFDNNLKIAVPPVRDMERIRAAGLPQYLVEVYIRGRLCHTQSLYYNTYGQVNTSWRIYVGDNCCKMY